VSKQNGFWVKLLMAVSLLAFPVIGQAQHGHYDEHQDHYQTILIIDNDTNDDLDIYVDHDFIGEIHGHEHEKRFVVSPGHHELEARCHEGRRWENHMNVGYGNAFKWRLI